MKLRNKHTGEIATLTLSTNGEDMIIMGNDMHAHITKLSELKDYEDYEEPAYYYFIQDDGRIGCDAVEPYNHKSKAEEHKSIGNYFGTREEAEKAVEKLKAWKRLKDKGFRFCGWWSVDHKKKCGKAIFKADECMVTMDEAKQFYSDIDFLFGGEE